MGVFLGNDLILKSAERPTVAATSSTPPEDTSISSSPIQDILMTFIDNYSGTPFGGYELHDDDDCK